MTVSKQASESVAASITLVLVKWSRRVNAPQNTADENRRKSANIRLVHAAPSRPLDIEASGPRHRASEKSPPTNQEESSSSTTGQDIPLSELPDGSAQSRITFSDGSKPNRGKALRIPGPREFEEGICSLFPLVNASPYMHGSTMVANNY